MDVIYYYYYLFYTRILSDDQPNMTVIFTLSVSESFLINGIASLISLKFFCYYINVYPLIGILIMLLISNYLYFYKTNRMKAIVKEKPKIYNSNILSIIITVLFFLGTTSLMFLGPIYIKHYLDVNCQTH